MRYFFLNFYFILFDVYIVIRLFVDATLSAVQLSALISNLIIYG